jgi:hypothetical protein
MDPEMLALFDPLGLAFVDSLALPALEPVARAEGDLFPDSDESTAMSSVPEIRLEAFKSFGLSLLEPPCPLPLLDPETLLPRSELSLAPFEPPALPSLESIALPV